MIWTPAKLGQLLTLEYGKALPRSERVETGAVPVAGSNGCDGNHDTALVEGPGIVVGRKGSAGKVTWFDTDFWPIDTTYFVRHEPKVTNLRWLYHLLRFKKLERLSKTTGVPGLNRNDAYAEACMLPAPKEQQRIVQLLDEADRIRQLRVHADARAAKILPALFLHMFGPPAAWQHSEPLGQLVTMKSGGTPSKSIPEFWTGAIPWVSPKDMKRDEIEDAEDHVSESAIAQTAVQLVPLDSILIVVRGMILARDVPVAIARRPVTINQDMKALVLNDQRLDPLYLFASVKTQAARLLAEVTTAAHGTKKLETNRLANLPIRIPSPAELQSFSFAYSQLLAIDRLRAAASPRVDELFSSLLQQAFSGRLTAKWRESHMKELLVEIEQQARLLNVPLPQEATA